jgi:hypothetical protein
MWLSVCWKLSQNTRSWPEHSRGRSPPPPGVSVGAEKKAFR